MTVGRRTAAVLSVAALVALAGCGGGSGNEPIEATADAATVGDGALDATGYSHEGTTSQQLNTSVTLSVQGDIEVQATRQVNATLRVARYRRSIDAGVAAFAAVSSPAVEPLDQFDVAKNPLDGIDTVAVVNRAQAVADVERLRRTGETEPVEILGNETTLTVYEGSANGTAVTAYVGTVRHDGDYVTVVAVHPVGADERSRVLELAAGVEH